MRGPTCERRSGVPRCGRTHERQEDRYRKREVHVGKVACSEDAPDQYGVRESRQSLRKKAEDREGRVSDRGILSPHGNEYYRPGARAAARRKATLVIDIMLPFYGREDHFRLAVESVLSQDDSRWRLVIIDDAYPDTAPGEWAQSISDPRLTYIRHSVNQGINRTFQECLELSRAEWVVIFGCDDIMAPGYVRRILELASAEPDALIIHPGVNIIDAAGRPARTLVDTAKSFYRPRGSRPVILSGQEFAVSVTRGNWMNFPALAWHAPTVRAIGFRPDFQVVQDLALALDVCRRGGSLVLDDEPVFSYRRHAGSVSSWRAVDGSRFEEERAFFVAEANDFADRGWKRAARAARVHLSSRINALTRLPSAVAAGDSRGIRALLRHAFWS